MLPLYEKPRLVKLIETKKQDYQSLERKDGNVLFNGYRISVWDDEKVLGMDDDDGCTTM